MNKFCTWWIAFLLAGLEANAQVVLQPAILDFGVVTRDSEPVIDILLENTSSKKDFVLRHTFSHEYEVRFTTKNIEGGDQAVLRVRLNPRVKGPFNETVSIFFANSSTPMLLPVRADVQYVNPNGSLPCPDFSDRPAMCCEDLSFRVEVLDDRDGKPLSAATVRVEEQGYLRLKLVTDAMGMAGRDIRIGYYEIRAEKSGYLSASVQTYINRRTNRFVIRLQPDPDFNPLTDALYIPPVEREEYPVALSGETLLPETSFKPNNVVFLLDISGSMGIGDKMELLRESMSGLILALRPSDHIALVSYADEAKVILPSASGDDRELLNQVVAELRAGGKTSGTKGFNRSYSILRKNLLHEGNNQLIVITDGAFRPDDQASIEKLVKRASRKGIKTSLVAIRGSLYATEKLSALSETGNGSFLRIDSKDDAVSVLLDELKKQSRK